MALTRRLLRSDLVRDLKRNIAEGVYRQLAERAPSDGLNQVSRERFATPQKSLEQQVIKSVPGSEYISEKS